MTTRSAPISLFAEPSTSRRGRGSTSFALSMVLHAVGCGLLYYALTRFPRIDYRLMDRYSVRSLELHSVYPQTVPAQAAKSHYQLTYPGPYSVPASDLPAGLTADMHTFLENATGKQTLIQPEVPKHQKLEAETPLPQVVLWNPGLVSRKQIVAPPVLATSSPVTPSLDVPNEETRLAEMSVAATDVPARSVAIPAGSTSPVQSPSTKPAQTAPATVSSPTDRPTSTAVLSLSDLRMREGQVILPPVNEMAASGGGSSTSGQAGKPAAAGGGLPGDAHSTSETGTQSEAKTNSGDEDGPAPANPSTEHIVLPRNGRFGVVVVGTSLAEEYPEAVDFWKTRVAYTAYLHVGMSKNWILQYSVLRSAEAAAAGSVTRLEAPWPYNIVRPNLLSSEVNADALMVHGILNQAGRLESLAIAFPAGFRYASFLLHVLRQWQFRPAQQNGQATAVEVLLIIPEELE